MRSEKLEKLKEIVYELSSVNRLSSSEGFESSLNLIKNFLRKERIAFLEENFEIEKNIPLNGEVSFNGTSIKAYPFVGSIWGNIEGEVVEENEDVKGKIALAKVGGRREKEKVKELKERGSLGVIFYSEEVDSPFIGNIDGENIIAVSVNREAAKRLKNKKIKLISKVKKTKIKGKNILFEIGKGPIVYVIAHLDTKPFVYGAIDNAVSVALLLMLAKELKKSHRLFSRLRFLITDCEELGLEGSFYHVKKLKKLNHLKFVRYVINVDSVGWFNPAVIYKDSEGYNGERIMEAFYNHINDLKVNIPFREGKRGRSDHIPFKREGIETLFLSSNPFTIRHTFYDTFEAVDWDTVCMWYEVLFSFLQKIYKF